MKTEKELKELKEEMEEMSKKPRELTEEELAQVTGGSDVPKQEKEIHIYENTLDGFDPPNY